LEFLDVEEDGMEDTFFPGSDDDLGMNESDREGRDEEEKEEGEVPLTPRQPQKTSNRLQNHFSHRAQWKLFKQKETWTVIHQ